MKGLFEQEAPIFSNDNWSNNSSLQRMVLTFVPHSEWEKIRIDLQSFTKQCDKISTMGMESNRLLPKLVTWNAWGGYENRIEVAKVWKEDLHEIAAKEGLIALGYGPNANQFSRLHQFIKLFG